MDATARTKAKPRSATAHQRASGADWKVRRAGGVQILRAHQLVDLDWLVHAFSTRPGGESELQSSAGRASERVLNLGFTDWDDRRNVLRNREKFTACIGAAAMDMVALRQMHSDIVHRIEAAASGPTLQGDALFTRERGILLTVQTADCVPILIADIRARAIAAIHSGWRGTLNRIAEKTLGRMKMEFGTRPEDVIAAIGPGIGGCCYEVGHEVAKEFAAQFPQAHEWFKGPFAAIASGDNDPNWLPWLTMAPPGHAPEPPRAHLDLMAANRSILAAAGVQPERIVVSQFCTSCRTDLLFSYRKERKTGRMMAAIGIRGESQTRYGKRKSK
ncbi:MAG: peptidoglycan editing factor PgeF [Candidatus Acidiferrales bacterium]